MIDAQENTAATRFDNSNYTNASVVQLRLNTETLIQEIEALLRGSATVVLPSEDGGYTTKAMTTGSPLANEQGVQYILQRLKSVVNSQTVQGNFKEEELMNFLADFQISLTEMVVLHVYAWEIQEADMDVIVDSIMNLVHPFMTRTLFDGERKSYANTIMHSESSKIQENGGLNIFKRKG